MLLLLFLSRSLHCSLSLIFFLMIRRPPRSTPLSLHDALPISWMDKNGIDHQLVGGWLDSFGYELPTGEGLAWSRFYNDCLKEELGDETRFTPLATVPLQHGGLAAEVLAEVLERGFGGVMIGTLPNGNS